MDDGPVTPPNPTWLTQGPEVFGAEPSGKGNRRFLVIIAVVVVIALGAGAYFLFFTGKDDTPPVTQQTTQPTTPTSSVPPPKPKDNLSIADLPSTPEEHDNITTFANAITTINFLTEEEAKLFTDAGAGKARMAASVTSDGMHPSVFTTETTSAEAANTAVQKLAQQEINYGLVAIEGAPTGILASKIDKTANSPAVIRAHYASKSTVIRIQVTGDNMATVLQVFNQVALEQLKVLAANNG